MEWSASSVAISPAAVIGEYEGAVREAGYEPGAVLPSTLAALAGLSGGPPSLVVNCNRYSMTTAIVSENDLLLYRTLELAEPDSSHTYESDPTRTGEELRQSVSVAIAYFEDTLLEAPNNCLLRDLAGRKNWSACWATLASRCTISRRQPPPEV